MVTLVNVNIWNIPLEEFVYNELSFYCFPAWKQNEGSHVSDVTKWRRMAWISAIRRTDIHFADIPRSLKVCSRHFHSGKPAYEMDESHPDWAPTLHLGHSEVTATVSDRHARRQHRHHLRESEGGGQNEQNNVNEDERDGVQEDEENREQTETVKPAAKRLRAECQLCEQSSAELTRLLQENRELRSELNKLKMDEEFFKDNTEKVQYYTGLPCFAILLSTFTTVKPFLPVAKKLSQFQMVLLTLIRLRLDLPIQHLSHIFNVSRRTLSATFADTIDVLYARLTPLLYWPERHCLQATMPHQFLEAFGKRVAIIVDCFEIRTERPSNLMARTQSFSHNKGTHTIKYLIGITPPRPNVIYFKGRGGEGRGERASDKHITENCGLLNKLLPGDLVLADQGFDIKDSVGMMCAEVKIPAFTKRRCQLDAKDVEDTHAIAHLRIHVERVIGSLRNKYTLLHNTISISLLLPCKDEEFTLLDKLVNVCCILVNMCPSVVVRPDETEKCAC
uniref:THAP-type domain-containing protein n=1 Tax=Sinocyclocheilus rhinocerous TaxID=307959 RepID=A0A673I977_9TELE